MSTRVMTKMHHTAKTTHTGVAVMVKRCIIVKDKVVSSCTVLAMAYRLTFDLEVASLVLGISSPLYSLSHPRLFLILNKSHSRALLLHYSTSVKSALETL
jgi:hypothetical protein